VISDYQSCCICEVITTYPKKVEATHDSRLGIVWIEVVVHEARPGTGGDPDLLSLDSPHEPTTKLIAE
jgi:hypothetical protein